VTGALVTALTTERGISDIIEERKSTIKIESVGKC